MVSLNQWEAFEHMSYWWWRLQYLSRASGRAGQDLLVIMGYLEAENQLLLPYIDWNE